MTWRHVPDATFSLQFAQSIKWQRQVLIPLNAGVIKSVAFVSDLQCIQIGFERYLTKRVIAPPRIDGSKGACSGRKKAAVVTTEIRDWESGFSSTAPGRQSNWRYR
jgi:hypothetical protein